jgi:hypothetical protein
MSKKSRKLLTLTDGDIVSQRAVSRRSAGSLPKG